MILPSVVGIHGVICTSNFLFHRSPASNRPRTGPNDIRLRTGAYAKLQFRDEAHLDAIRRRSAVAKGDASENKWGVRWEVRRDVRRLRWRGGEDGKRGSKDRNRGKKRGDCVRDTHRCRSRLFYRVRGTARGVRGREEESGIGVNEGRGTREERR